MSLGHRRSARGGFSLLEVAVATAIVGIALAALLVAVASNTQVNEAGRRLTHAIFLAQEIREWTLALPFSDPDVWDANNPPGPDGTDPHVFVDDLDDLMDVTYAPPRDGQGQAIDHMAGWSQAISMTWRDPNDLSIPITPGSSDVIYVQVNIAYKDQPVLGTGWLVTRRENP